MKLQKNERNRATSPERLKAWGSGGSTGLFLSWEVKEGFGGPACGVEAADPNFPRPEVPQLYLPSLYGTLGLLGIEREF